MTTEKIIEGNRLIADFLGQEKVTGKIADEQRQFHSSWDWLMPVVEKIENGFIDTKNAESGYVVTITGYSCTIETMLGGEICEGFEEKKILSVWQAVVRFIEWINIEMP